MGDPSDEHFENAAVEAFVSQPPRPADDTAAATNPADGQVVRASWRQRLNHFFFEKKPTGYSSISPRTPDGRRTKPFFFNGNGQGR
ncbi:MAG: hypothetical protein ACYDEH_11055 [Acidimicrobiales bacterium]